MPHRKRPRVIDPCWLELRREFDETRRNCSSAFTAIIRAIEAGGGVPGEDDVARWRFTRQQRQQVDDRIEAYLDERLKLAGEA